MDITELIGKKFGRLTVIRFHSKNKNHAIKLVCKCECGNEKIVIKGNLILGTTSSCGCLNKEKITKHGKTGTRIYRIWRNIKSRCLNKTYRNYKDYGGRGIDVYEEWLKFEPFEKWSLENGYDSKLTIDRIDNDKGYSPDNYRWVDMKTQSTNRRVNVFIEINGERKTISQWSEELGINPVTLKYRHEQGYEGEKLISKPKPGGPEVKLTEKDVIEIRELCKKGVFQKEIAKKYNISKNYVSNIHRRKAWKHVE